MKKAISILLLVFIAAGVFYYVMNGVIEIIMNHVEKSMRYYS